LSFIRKRAVQIKTSPLHFRVFAVTKEGWLLHDVRAAKLQKIPVSQARRKRLNRFAKNALL